MTFFVDEFDALSSFVYVQERYQQLDFRLAHLLHCDTAELMALTADSSSSCDEHDETNAQPSSSNDSNNGSSNRTPKDHHSLLVRSLYRLLPAALRWTQHKQQFHLIRNEGVPLLLGSVYGADFLQAALTATLALPQPATVVLADQQQQLTMARFRLLADGLGQLQQLLVAAVAGVAHAEKEVGLMQEASDLLVTLEVEGRHPTKLMADP
eukprot:gene10028-10184_t